MELVWNFYGIPMEHHADATPPLPYQQAINTRFWPAFSRSAFRAAVGTGAVDFRLRTQDPRPSLPLHAHHQDHQVNYEQQHNRHLQDEHPAVGPIVIEQLI